MLIRSIGYFFVMAVLAAGPVRADAAGLYVGEISADRVYVRAGQHTNYEAVALLKKGDRVVVLAKSYSWLRIKVPPQSKAYINTQHVNYLSSDIGEVKATRVNVRSAPSTESTILGKLERGRRFYIIENNNEWVSIKPVDELSGWIKEEYVTPLKTAVPPVLYPAPHDPFAAGKTVASSLPSDSRPPLPAALKQIDHGRYEVAGKLEKDPASKPSYRMIKDNAVACLVEGPDAVLKPFLGSEVKVTGTLKDARSSSGEPVLDLLKVSHLL
jgi:SH3-like domain-containing protein